MISVGRLVNPEFSKAMVKLTRAQLPIKEAYRLSFAIEKLNGELDSFNAKRQELVLKYAQKDERGEPATQGSSYVFGDNLAEFNAALQKLLDEEFEVETFDVALFEGVTLSVEEAILLQPVLSKQHELKQ